MRDPTLRFSDRVADYVRARPAYPPELLDLLRESQGFAAAWVVADVGSGTGNPPSIAAIRWVDRT